MKKQSYKDLVVWNRAIDFVPKVYSLLKRFPKEEMYALSGQIRRAAVSVPANIAEGQARRYEKEFVQHLAIAKGSLAELDTLFIVAHRLGYVTDKDLDLVETEISTIRKPLLGLIQAVLHPQPTTHNPQPTDD